MQWPLKEINFFQPECQLRVDHHCHDIQTRGCRFVKEVEYRNFAVKECLPKPKTECFEYQKKVCTPAVVPDLETITWCQSYLHKVKNIGLQIFEIVIRLMAIL
jgi:hypothetical protein